MFIIQRYIDDWRKAFKKMRRKQETRLGRSSPSPVADRFGYFIFVLFLSAQLGGCLDCILYVDGEKKRQSDFDTRFRVQCFNFCFSISARVSLAVSRRASIVRWMCGVGRHNLVFCRRWLWKCIFAITDAEHVGFLSNQKWINFQFFQMLRDSRFFRVSTTSRWVGESVTFGNFWVKLLNGRNRQHVVES